METYICVIDLGTQVTKALVARIYNTSVSSQYPNIDLVAASTTRSLGMKSGFIVNIYAASQSIREVLHEVELISGTKVTKVIVNISGKHLCGSNEKGVVAVAQPKSGIDLQDIIRSIEYAQENIYLPADKQFLHVLSRQFAVDRENNIKDPIGMQSQRLEADVHIISASKTALSNIKKTFSQIGIEVSDIVMNSLASAEAVLSTEHKESGIAVIDIGEGVSDMIAYTDGGASFSHVIPYAGFHLTQDISIGLQVSLELAEMLKKNHGSALARLVDPLERIENMYSNNGNSESLELSSQGLGNGILRHDMVFIMEARLREIFTLLKNQYEETHSMDQLNRGIVLCGGTTSLEGIEECAQEVFGVPCVVSSPNPSESIGGFFDQVAAPDYTAVVGMLVHKNKNDIYNETFYSQDMRSSNPTFMHRFKNWMFENF